MLCHMACLRGTGPSCAAAFVIYDGLRRRVMAARDAEGRQVSCYSSLPQAQRDLAAHAAGCNHQLMCWVTALHELISCIPLRNFRMVSRPEVLLAQTSDMIDLAGKHKKAVSACAAACLPTANAAQEAQCWHALTQRPAVQPLFWGATDDGRFMFGTTHEDLGDCNPTATAFPAG